MKAFFVSVFVVALVLLGAWIGGFDFNERGPDALVLSVLALLAGVYAYIISGGSL